MEEFAQEGYPPSQWRGREVTVGRGTTDDNKGDKDKFWTELPMPHNYHLLPKHSQEILRIARMPPKIRKAVAPLEEDGGDVEDEEKPKEVQNGFPVRKLVKLDRDNGQEAPEPNYLAKRRKVTSTTNATQGPAPLRETKVKKVDAEGNVSVFTALVPEGQSVPGEVLPTDAALAEVVPAAAAPGTVVEGIGVVNAQGVVVVNDMAKQTPPRRRPAPPKKKGRRGRKKVVFAEGAVGQGTPASGSDRLAVPGFQRDGGSLEPSDGDTPMADAGDEEDGEDGSEEDGEERAHSPTPASVEFRSKSAEATVGSVVPQGLHRQPSPTALGPTDTGVQQPPSTLQASESAPNVVDVSGSGNLSNSHDIPLSATAHNQETSLAQAPTVQASEAIMPSAAQGAMTNASMSTAPGASRETSASVVLPEEPISQTPGSQLPPSSAAGPSFGLNIPEQGASAQPTSQSATAAAGTPALLSTHQDENHPSPDLLGSLEAHLNQDM